MLPGKLWTSKAERSGRLRRSSGFNGLRYRYVIREGNTAAVELQIETADSVANRRLVQLLEKQRRIIEAAFGAALDWNDDAELNPDRSAPAFATGWARARARQS